MNGVEAQPVEMEVVDPADRVLDEVPPHVVAPGVGDVHRVAPRRAIGVGEVRPVPCEHVALGAHVVVDDVEHDGEAEPVGGVDEAGEAIGAAVGMLHGVGEHAVVAPVASAGELGDRHHLDRGDAEFAQSGKVTDRGVEGALGGERADVHLVEHGVGELDTGPGVVVPSEHRLVDHRRRPVDARRAATSTPGSASSSPSTTNR
jgi:hypothetical protein